MGKGLTEKKRGRRKVRWLRLGNREPRGGSVQSHWKDQMSDSR